MKISALVCVQLTVSGVAQVRGRDGGELSRLCVDYVDR
jgi:hypothetical protein